MARILLVDDEEPVRQSLATLMESEGHSVMTAACGREALRSQRRSPADLIITDLMMPGEQGFETIMKFRQMWRDLPIVAISGRGELLPTALNFGATHTFPKPVKPVELLKAVGSLLAQEPPIKLLLLEDDESFAGVLADLFEREPCLRYETRGVTTLREALDQLENREFDVVVADLGLRDSQGMETFEGVKQAAPDTPIVVLTGGGDAGLGIRAMKRGAQEFISKVDLNPLLFPRLVRHAIERKKIELSLRREHKRVEMLLQNLLPTAVARRFGQGEVVEPMEFDDIPVLFADLVGFTKLAASMTPGKIVEMLNRVFSSFDHLAQQHGLEKIKTIGDAYMVAGGIPEPVENGPLAVTELALGMLEEINLFNRLADVQLNLRIGIATGPVVAGIIGIDKISYDLWGDTVNLASRMESHGEAGRIQVCSRTRELLVDHFILDDRGSVSIKGKGNCRTYFVAGRKFGTS
ncbi:MAG: adenylate/guanylate cyclase domain-containing protein [Limisphaerales bacterium]